MNNKIAINLIWQVPDSLNFERQWFLELLDNFEVHETVDGKNEVFLNNALIITQGKKLGNLETFEYIKLFKERGFHVGCFHISDETASLPVDFYRFSDFVFRNQYRRIVNVVKNAHYISLGYKSGFTKSLQHKNITERKYFFSYIGQLKTTRFTMVEEAKLFDQDSFFHFTEKWDDPNQMSIEEYAVVLNDTVFALCPMGNISMDTFRLYEALEAGAIPIVESRNFRMVLAEIANNIFTYKSGIRVYLSRLYPMSLQINYWKHAYGKDFPIPVIYDWKNLQSLIEKIDVEETSAKTQLWWKNNKQSLKNLITETITSAFMRRI